MRIALVHDFLCAVGGSERIFQYLCEEFPEADVYTLAFNPEKTFPYFKERKVNTTWLNRCVRSVRSFRWAFPVATYAMERLNLDNYDVVLSSSATVAKYVRPKNGIHICYCYIPTRAIWHFDEYFGCGWVANTLRFILPHLRSRDIAAAQKINRFVTISGMSREYIRSYYGRDSEIVHCPVNIDRFSVAALKGKHFLVVSRLERWKRLDYAIQAFNRLELPLRVVGGGADEGRLRSMAGRTIEFVGEVDDSALAQEYSSARAVIFTPFIEYGLIPLEAVASGTPVIAYGRGGVTETMIPVSDTCSPSDGATAVFFDQQTPEDLVKAVHRFESIEAEFKNDMLIMHAQKWNIDAFKVRMRSIVDSAIAAT